MPIELYIYLTIRTTHFKSNAYIIFQKYVLLKEIGLNDGDRSQSDCTRYE